MARSESGMSLPFQEQLLEYLKDPTPAAYRRLRTTVVQSACWDPYSRGLDDVLALIEREDYPGAERALRTLVPGFLLSPYFHLIFAHLYERLGRPESAEGERRLGHLLLDAILETGDGTEDRPYLVTRIRDERDVLVYLGKQLETQALIHRGDRSFDRLDCADGTSVWFDVTDMMWFLNRTNRPE